MAVTGRGIIRAVFAAILLMPCFAFSAEPIRIHDILVEGTQRIEVETVKSYLTLSEGDPYDAGRVDKSLKILYATGFFSDVSIRLEGSKLVIRVVENPIINRLSFEGLKKIKEENIKSEIQLKPRVVYSRTKVQADVKRILEMYRRSGRFAATVDPKIIQLDQNRVDLVFEVNEGPGTYVKRINFIGNKVYAEQTLQENIQTQEERWYRFMSSDDTYDPDRVNYDREMLRRFYLRHGYADFRVTSAVAELTPNRESFFITFTVDEGARYKMGAMTIDSQLKNFKADELKPLLLGKTGDWYNGDQVEKNVQNLTDALGTRGFAFVDVRPDIRRDENRHVVDITFKIGEGPKVYVDRVDISGNVRTLDKVIRREFALAEGDAFNSAKLRRTQQRLKDLNFFEKVDVTNVPSETAPDRTVIKAEVQEKSTGELSFGIGYSTLSGPMLNASMRERNLLGRGQDLTVSGGIGTQVTNASVSFTEPYFLDRPLSAGWDAFRTTNNLQYLTGYDFESVGGALRTGYAITEQLSQSWRLQAKQDTVKNLADGVSVYIEEQKGTWVTSSIQHGLMYDRRDSRVEPTAGYYARIINEVSGLGGDSHFIKDTVGGAYYFTVSEDMVAHTSATVGEITSYNGRPVRITDRMFMGGDTLRGFADYGIGPRDHNTNTPLGAKWMAYGSTQLGFPVGLPKDFGVMGHCFVDYGSIGHTDATPLAGSSIDQFSSFRGSAGVGVSWKSPMGPIAVDLAMPFMKEKIDKTQIFRFNFGSKF